MKFHRLFMPFVVFCLFVATIFFFHPTANANNIASTTYYVATTGSDSNPGSLAQPWVTIQHAADSISAGDTVLVRGGLYNETVYINVSGSAVDGHVTFRNYASETPILDGGNTLLCGFCIDGHNYIVIDGFEIRNYQSTINWTDAVGIKVAGETDYIQLLNNRIHAISANPPNALQAIANGIAIYGTSPQPSQHILVDGNEVYDLTLGWSESVVLNGNVDTFTVTNNIIHDNNNIGIDIIGHESWIESDFGVPANLNEARNGLVARNNVYNIDSVTNPVYGGGQSAPCLYVDGGSNVVMEHNVAHDCNFGVSIGSENTGYDSYNIIVRSNFIYHNDIGGIVTGGSDVGNGGARDNAIVNNTLFHNNQISIDEGEVWIQENVRDTIIENNIVFAGNGNSFVVNWATAPTGATIDYNIYFSSGTAGASNWAWNNNYIGGFTNYRTTTGNDAHSQWVDPQLVDEIAPDLHIMPLSVAADDGIALSESGTLDIDLQNRVQGSAVDIGADEIVVQTPTTIALSEYYRVTTSSNSLYFSLLAGLFLIAISVWWWKAVDRSASNFV